MEIKQLPKGYTDAHIKMWQVMSDGQLGGFRFIRQVLVEPFIVDFACTELKVIVELDRAPSIERQDCEQRRTQFLQNQGYAVVRFWCNEVLTNITTVTLALRQTLSRNASKLAG